MDTYFYSAATGQTYSAYQLQALFGIDVTDTALISLNLRGFYPVQPTSPDFDTALYEATSTWSIVPITGGEGAERVWTPVPRPLAQAQANASQELKNQANTAVNIEACECGFTTDMLTGVASQDEIDRPSRYQAELESIAAIAGNLDSNLTAVESATSVDEINDVVNPPAGLLFTGRGSGLGPEDLNVSYYTQYNSVSLPESDTELYVPSTATTIAYGSGGPGKFDSMGNAFNPGGPYTMQIRNSKTSAVIAEIVVPLNPAGEDVAF
jgi:hypothetical protein